VHLEQYFDPTARHVFVDPKNGKNIVHWADVMEWTDYVYLPGARISSPPDRAVAFLPPRHETGARTLVLFVDGHIERNQSKISQERLTSPTTSTVRQASIRL
jgi:hypothetical protein